MGSAAVHAGFPPLVPAWPAAYRQRNPQATSLYQLFDAYFDTLKCQWEERFERRYGFWRAFWDSAVFSYLDCGRFESGFARVVCPECRYEFLVAFSCKGRGLCPSCAAKRAAIFSSLLQEKIRADVPHAQWVFTLPKMFRPYFLHHRELLGELARLAYDTVREMMAAAADEPGARPGMVAVIQTFGSSLKWRHKSFLLERLRKIVVHTRGEATIAKAIGRVSGQGHDGDAVSVDLALANASLRCGKIVDPLLQTKRHLPIM